MAPGTSLERLRSIEPLSLERVGDEGTGRIDDDPEAALGFVSVPAELAEVRLSIEQARALALMHNLELQVELIGPTIAAQTVSEEAARFESLITANVVHLKTDTPTSSTLEGSRTQSQSGDVGVSLPLTTGGVLSARLPINRSETDNVFSTLNPAVTSSPSASISQPLLRNAGVRTNTHGIRVARYQSRSAEAAAKLQVMRIIADVDRIYWQLYATRRELEVRQQQHQLAQEQLDRAKRRVDNDLAPRIEILRAESGMADRLEAIIVAEVSVREAQRSLKRAINKPDLDIGSRTIVVPETEPNPLRYRLDGNRLAASALEQRMEMLEIEIQYAIDSSTIDFLGNQSLPVLNLDYAYAVNGLGGSLGDATDVLRDKNFEDHRIALRFEMPLGNEAAKSRLRRALLTRIQRLSTKAQRALSIRQEVLNAVDRLETTWHRIMAARQRSILSARTAAAEQRQFDQGLRTSTDVLEVQTNLADAQSAEIAAMTAYQIAQVDLAVATGTLLG
ncbi:MAG: TolC family protein, partial [Phycisphaerae bacterium]|nr:TolC family protein [Phycisphaerae bacterium]